MKMEKSVCSQRVGFSKGEGFRISMVLNDNQVETDFFFLSPFLDFATNKLQKIVILVFSIFFHLNFPRPHE